MSHVGHGENRDFHAGSGGPDVIVTDHHDVLPGYVRDSLRLRLGAQQLLMHRHGVIEPTVTFSLSLSDRGSASASDCHGQLEVFRRT